MGSDEKLKRRRKKARKMEVGSRVGIAAAVVVVVLLSSFFLSVSAAQKQQNIGGEAQCSRTCLAINCDTFGIRYGKYCGVGHTGCAGEKPCDEVDACCKLHDDCTGMHGVVGAGSECHEKFKKCLRRVHKSGKAGFSKECPYSTVIPTMVQGMDMALLFGGLGANFGL